MIFDSVKDLWRCVRGPAAILSFVLTIASYWAIPNILSLTGEWGPWLSLMYAIALMGFAYHTGKSYGTSIAEATVGQAERKVEHLQSTIEGKDKALETQKERNAELAARLRDLTLEDNRKRRIFNTLNEREKWLLAAILDMSPMVPSSNDNRIIHCLKFMCDAGILLDTGIVTVNGAEEESFTIKSDWRTWLSNHADELPKPHSDMPE